MRRSKAMTEPVPDPNKVKVSELAELRKKAKAYEEGQIRDGGTVVERDTEMAVKIAKLEIEVERLKEQKVALAEGGNLARELGEKWGKVEAELETLRTQLALNAAPPKKEEGPKTTEKEERASCARCGAAMKIPAGSELAGKYQCPECDAPLTLEA